MSQRSRILKAGESEEEGWRCPRKHKKTVTANPSCFLGSRGSQSEICCSRDRKMTRATKAHARGANNSFRLSAATKEGSSEMLDLLKMIKIVARALLFPWHMVPYHRFLHVDTLGHQSIHLHQHKEAQQFYCVDTASHGIMSSNKRAVLLVVISKSISVYLF